MQPYSRAMAAENPISLFSSLHAPHSTCAVFSLYLSTNTMNYYKCVELVSLIVEIIERY